jgi:hypothetical protein
MLEYDDKCKFEGEHFPVDRCEVPFVISKATVVAGFLPYRYLKKNTDIILHYVYILGVYF